MRLSSLLNLWRVDMTGMTVASLFYEASDEAQKRKGATIEFLTLRELTEQRQTPAHCHPQGRERSPCVL